MELKLLHPVGDMTTVNVGVPTMRIFETKDTVNYWHDGSMGSRLIAHLVCDSKNHEKYKNISSIDGLRIARLSKRLMTNARYYTPKGLRDKDGGLVLLQHDLELDVEPTKAFFKVHDYQGRKVKLKQQSVTDQTRMVMVMTDKPTDNKVLVEVLRSYVDTIDDKRPDFEDLPLPFLHWLSEIIADDKAKFDALSKASKVVNGETYEHIIGLFNFEFLLDG